ncbi:hypothetical protein Hypma_016533 [Hypsizygus marmoreus]|uniref:Uncharacterized protein n=1 Tax=Hypsizygus marmoreus TaxID=39966 RepID=A0A369IYT4_HYPMA|nr:hypothetical protein Hypma_016533 [Hypsizygus marmoreus]
MISSRWWPDRASIRCFASLQHGRLVYEWAPPSGCTARYTMKSIFYALKAFQHKDSMFHGITSAVEGFCRLIDILLKNIEESEVMF